MNADGFVDLIGTNSSGDLFVGPFDRQGRSSYTAPVPGPVFVWLNGGGGNHWLTLRLKGRMAIDGTGSNADGIGARVYVSTQRARQAAPHVQVQEARAGSSYLSMDSVDLEFGLGDARVVDKIEIIWPSGVTQIIQDTPANQVLEVIEPQS